MDTSRPWPHWLVRYVATNSQPAFYDLIWSVDGSPPWGGVSAEEADAVAALLNEYMGPGVAPEEAYDAVRAFLAGRPDDILVLELFRLHDQIASQPEDFTEDDVRSGLAFAESLRNEGVRSRFTLLGAQLRHARRDVGGAKDATLAELPVLERLAKQDGAYMEQLVGAATNAASFSVMDGDFTSARRAARLLRALGAEDRLGSLRRQLLPV
jgi:hypothetical protein